MSEVNNKDNVNGIILVSLLLTLNILHILFSVSIVNCEHAITGWVKMLHKD